MAKLVTGQRNQQQKRSGIQKGIITRCKACLQDVSLEQSVTGRNIHTFWNRAETGVRSPKSNEQSLLYLNPDIRTMTKELYTSHIISLEQFNSRTQLRHTTWTSWSFKSFG